MDPLNITASVIAVLQLSDKILNDVNVASKDRLKSAVKASHIHNLLLDLRFRLEKRSGDVHTAIRALGVENGPLDQFKQTLEELQSKMTDKGRLKRVGDALVWNFKKDEIASILDRIERFQALVELALQMDQFKLSEAIKDNTNADFVQTHGPIILFDIDKIQQGQYSGRHRRLLAWKPLTAYHADESSIVQRRYDGTDPAFHEKTGERERRLKGEKDWKRIMENRWRANRCFNCGSGGHWENNCPGSCGRCLYPGHGASSCRHPLCCIICRGQGHIAEDCPNQKLDMGIVGLLKSLDLPSYISDRERLAEKLQVDVGPTGSRRQNMALHKALMKEIALNDGEVPSSICNCNKCGRFGHQADLCSNEVGSAYLKAWERKYGQSKDYARENGVPSPIEDFQRSLSAFELSHVTLKEPDEEDLETDNLPDGEDVLTASADQSDSADDNWALESLFSNDMQSNSSRTSFSSTIQISATDAFADILIADDEIRLLCVNAIADRNVGPVRLERNLRRLLYRYLKDLSVEAASHPQFTIVKHLQSRSWLQRISNKVRRTVCGKFNRLDIRKGPPDRDAGIQRYLDNLSQPHKSVPEERSAESSSTDDDQEQEIDELRDFNVESLAAFLSNSRAFQLFKQNLQDFVSSAFSCGLDRVSQRILKQAGGSSNKNTVILLSVISQLQFVNPASILVSDLHVSLIDKWKYEVEQLSGTTWNWWPLQEPIHPLLPGHVYLQWQCRCGAHRRAQVPDWVGKGLNRVLDMFRSSSKSALPTHTQNVALQAQVTSRSDTDPSQQASNEAIRGSSETANNAPPKMTGYVFLGVKCGVEYRVAEINVHGLGDDQFFKELRAEYYKMKGYLKRFFSVWRFAHCDFVKFEKFDYDCNVPRGESMPENDADYQYVPKPRTPSDPMPPIDPHEFETRFYSCYGGGQRHKHILFSCNNQVCRPDDDALERIPKRTKALTVGIPKRGHFWGLYAQENISFMMVALYNFLLLGSPFAFWMCWLFVWNHQGDLQNASIPTAIVAALLPMFWLHLVTNKAYR